MYATPNTHNTKHRTPVQARARRASYCVPPTNTVAVTTNPSSPSTDRRGWLVMPRRTGPAHLVRNTKYSQHVPDHVEASSTRNLESDHKQKKSSTDLPDCAPSSLGFASSSSPLAQLRLLAIPVVLAVDISGSSAIVFALSAWPVPPLRDRHVRFFAHAIILPRIQE